LSPLGFCVFTRTINPVFTIKKTINDMTHTFK
jgi:hypothetical protein